MKIGRFPVLLYDLSCSLFKKRKIVGFLHSAGNQIFVEWTKIVNQNEKNNIFTKNENAHILEYI